MKATFFVHIFQMEVETLAAGISALAVSDISDLMRKITTLSNKLKTIQEQQVCGSVKHLLLAVDYRQVRGIICSLSMYVKIYKFRQYKFVLFYHVDSELLEIYMH